MILSMPKAKGNLLESNLLVHMVHTNPPFEIVTLIHVQTILCKLTDY